METFDLVLHVPLTVQAASLNIAKALVESAADRLHTETADSDIGTYSITVGTPRAALVKGPRPAKQRPVTKNPLAVV